MLTREVGHSIYNSLPHWHILLTAPYQPMYEIQIRCPGARVRIGLALSRTFYL